MALDCMYIALLGLRSFPNTAHPFLAAGIAKGPTPANTSATTSDGSNSFTRRSCSECKREFQYTWEKSKRKRQLDSLCSRSWTKQLVPDISMPQCRGWLTAEQGAHTKSTTKSGSPASTSILKKRNSLSMLSSLLTTVRRFLFFCRWN